MDEDALGIENHHEGHSDSDDLKKKIADQTARAAELTPEDVSRSSLHYGEEHEGEHSEEQSSDAMPPDIQIVDDGANPGEESRYITANRLSDAPPADEGATETRGIGTSGDVIERDDSDTGQRVASETESTEISNADEKGNSNAPDPNAFQQSSSSEPTSHTSKSGPSQSAPPQEVNHAPSEITLSNSSVPENAEGAVVGSLSATDQNVNDTHSYTVSDDRFEVVDGQVKLKDGISLDHEETDGLTLDVTATDGAGATFTQSFDIAVTDINEGPSSISLSNHAIAENAAGAVVGSLSATDQDVNDTHSFAVSDDRFEVVDGQVKLKDGIRLDHQETDALTLDVTATDSAGATFTQSFDITVADVPTVQIQSGFHASYFDVDQRISSIDDIDWNGSATHQELVDDINYENGRGSFWEGGSRDTFGAKITGNIEVDESGVFDFHIGGDDGVVLFINGKEVVNNDGLHGFRTRSGEVELEQGTHVIEVRYFENYGHAGLKVEWEGPGLDGRELLTPPGVDDLHTVNGSPLSLNLATDMEGSNADNVSQIIEGLPAGTHIQAGEMVLEVDESGTADITGWDTSMLMLTPPVDFNGPVTAQLNTRVTLENGDTATSTEDLSFSVDTANITPPEVQLHSGFRASYFDVDHSLSKLDQIDWNSDPTHEDVVSEIDYANGRDSFWEGGSKDTFGVRITGEITVEEEGSFDFFLGGDDGVVLFVDGVEVIDNDGLHGFRTRSGEIDLEPGTHEIEVRYFENYGHAGLKLEWEGPGTEGREFVRANSDLSVEENGILDLRLDDTGFGESATVTVSGLPADTILSSGSNSAVSDGSEIDLTGWDMDLIELMPPPGFEGMLSADVSITDIAFNGQPVHASHSYSIEVGDVSNVPANDSEQENMWLIEANQGDEANRGWADDHTESESAQDSSATEEDNVMEEQVTESQAAEQPSEMTDSYERHDW